MPCSWQFCTTQAECRQTAIRTCIAAHAEPKEQAAGGCVKSCPRAGTWSVSVAMEESPLVAGSGSPLMAS
jgi:hypothetical protein